MRISGIEPLSVILRQTENSKRLKSDALIMLKHAEAKTGWYNKPTKLQF